MLGEVSRVHVLVGQNQVEDLGVVNPGTESGIALVQVPFVLQVGSYILID